MDENHQNKTDNKLIATEDIRWAFNKKSKLWLAKQKKPTGFEEKTLWDWLDLLSKLAIPIVVLVATIGFGWWQVHLADLQHQSDQQLAQQQHATDQQRALDQQHATILQTYIDNIQNLLLNNNLLKSKPDDDVAILARARTLTALAALDPDRTGRLLQFLYEAKLIGFMDTRYKIHDPIIDLSGAHLSDAHLIFAHLSGAHLDRADLIFAHLDSAHLYAAHLYAAHLSGANLSYAHLIFAHLSGADLSGAHLDRADLSGANLSGAILSFAHLSGADLRYADLSGANLNFAFYLTQQQLDQVSSCKGATLPEVLTCPPGK